MKYLKDKIINVQFARLMWNRSKDMLIVMWPLLITTIVMVGSAAYYAEDVTWFLAVWGIVLGCYSIVLSIYFQAKDYKDKIDLTAFNHAYLKTIFIEILTSRGVPKPEAEKHATKCSKWALEMMTLNERKKNGKN